MTSETLCAACGFCPAVGDGERTVTGVFTGDLPSWAMGRAKEGDIWFTVMGNLNTVAVASLSDVACVVLCEGISMDEPGLAKAKEQGINICSVPSPIFEAAYRVHQLL